MKYCPNCGCELKDEVLTCCLECGEPLPVVKKKRKKKKARKVKQVSSLRTRWEIHSFKLLFFEN